MPQAPGTVLSPRSAWARGCMPPPAFPRTDTADMDLYRSQPNRISATRRTLPTNIWRSTPEGSALHIRRAMILGKLTIISREEKINSPAEHTTHGMEPSTAGLLRPQMGSGSRPDLRAANEASIERRLANNVRIDKQKPHYQAIQ